MIKFRYQWNTAKADWVFGKFDFMTELSFTMNNQSIYEVFNEAIYYITSSIEILPIRRKTLYNQS